MDIYQKELEQVKTVLQAAPRGMTISSIADRLGVSRNSVAKYLEIMLIAGEVEMKPFGRSKIYRLSGRMPLATVLSLSSELIIFLDRNLRIIDVNDQFLRFNGLKRDQVAGRPFDEVNVDLLNHRDVLLNLKDALKGREYAREICIRRGGEEHFFKVKLIPVSSGDAHGRLAITFENITARKRAEIALKESEARYRAVVEDQTDRIMRLLPDSTITFLNESCAKCWHWDGKDVLGRRLYDIIRPEGMALIKKNLDKISARQESVSFEGQVTMQDGMIRWHNWTCRGIFDENGRLVEYQIVANDINDRKQVATALEEANTVLEKKVEERTAELTRSRNTIQTVLDTAPTIVVVTDAKTQEITYVSPSIKDLLGFDILGSIEGPDHLGITILNADGTPIDCADWPTTRTLRDGRPVRNEECILKDHGNDRYFMVNSAPVCSPDGQVAAAVTTLAEITVRKQVEEDLRKAVRELLTHSGCIQAIVHATGERSLLEDICKIMVDKGGYPMAWIGMKETDGTVRPAAQAGDREYLKKIVVRWEKTSYRLGPVGTAIRSGKPCVMNSLADVTGTMPWVEEARAAGYAAIAAVPLSSNRGVLGAISIYSRNLDAFDEREIDLLGALANDIAFGIVSWRRREERNAAARALTESEERLRLCAATARFGTFDWDIASDRHVWSPETYEIYGLPPGTPMTMERLRAIIYPGDELEHTLSEGMDPAGPGEYAMEYRIIRPADGAIRWVYLKSHVLFDGEGPGRRAVRIIGLVMDTTKRKQVEEEIRESRKKLADIIDHLPDPTFVIDQCGKVIAWNKAIAEMTGVKAADVLGKGNYEYAMPFYGVRKPVLIDRVFARDGQVSRGYQDVQRDGSAIIAETRSARLKGKKVTFWIKASPFFDDSGKIIGAIESLRDISEQNRTEEALRDSEEMFRVLADTTKGAILILQDSRVVYANPAAVRLTGYGMEDLATMRLEELIDPGQRGKILERARAHVQGEMLPDMYEVRFTDKTGAARWAEVSVGTVEYDKRPGRMITAFEITERKTAESATAASLLEKEILLREIHHRVKNNMQIISSLLSLEAQQYKDRGLSEVFNESMNRIRTMALIHEKLYQSGNFSQIEFTSYVNSLLESLINSYCQAPGKVRGRVEGTPSFLSIEEAVPCGLIINELITNSLKYAFPGERTGEITITFQQYHSRFSFTVSDDGIGMPPGFAPEHSSSLGLQLVCLLVQQIDGVIETGHGPGASFSVSFSPQSHAGSFAGGTNTVENVHSNTE